MKNLRVGLVLLVSVAVLCGCVVQSIRPWLTDKTALSFPDLSGTWKDDKVTVTFFDQTNESVRIVLVDSSSKTNRMQATTHEINGTILMDIQPPEEPPLNEFEAFTYIPANLLYKVELSNSVLILHEVNVSEFDTFAGSGEVTLASGGSANDGFIITSDSAAVEAFVTAHLNDEGFFKNEPAFTLTRVLALTPVNTP